MDIGKTLKDLFSFKWLSKLFSGEVLGTAAGTAAGAGIGTTLLSTWGKLGDDTKQIILQKLFYVPPRADLMAVINKINPVYRRFWIDRMKEADEDMNTPAENEVAKAWCKVLGLRKERIPLKDKDGNPILIDIKGKKEPLYLYKPGLTNKGLGDLLEQIAKEGKESFWVWTKWLIHDPWAQRLDIIWRKIKNGVKPFIEYAKEISKDSDKKMEKEIYQFELTTLEKIRNRKIQKVDTSLRSSFRNLLNAITGKTHPDIIETDDTERISELKDKLKISNNNIPSRR